MESSNLGNFYLGITLKRVVEYYGSKMCFTHQPIEEKQKYAEEIRELAEEQARDFYGHLIDQGYTDEKATRMVEDCGFIKIDKINDEH